MSSKDCPKCRLINPKNAEVCDCGFMFSASSSKTIEFAHKESEKYKMQKKIGISVGVILLLATLRFVIKFYAK